MSAICKYCRKQPSVIIRGSHLCSRCNAAGIRSPRMPRQSRTRHRLDLGLAHDLRERVT
jgi:hypothetical protein